MNLQDTTKHYDYNQQNAMKEVIFRLSHIKKISDEGDPYMNKLKTSNKTLYNQIGDLKRKETESLKLLEKYLKEDKTRSHKKELNKIQNALRQNKEYLSW